jgi:CHAD domain-containing protein
MPLLKQRYDLLQKRSEQFTRMLHGLDGGDVRALHSTRVSSRRLREVLPILQLDGEMAHKLSRRLRKVTKRLGRVRNLDVLLLMIGELQDSGRSEEASLKRLAAVVSEERSEERERLVAKLPAAELHRVAGKLDKIARRLKATERAASAHHGNTAQSWRWAVEARLARRAARFATAIKDAGTVYLPERLHAVRIALKKMRYAVELSAEIAGQQTSPELRTLKRGQDLLGRLHDLQVLIDRVRQLQASLTPPDLVAWREFDALITSLENDCRRLHARYMRARPALLAVCDRDGARPPASAVRRRAG